MHISLTAVTTTIVTTITTIHTTFVFLSIVDRLCLWSSDLRKIRIEPDFPEGIT
jgi:hypothetical protein